LLLTLQPVAVIFEVNPVSKSNCITTCKSCQTKN